LIEFISNFIDPWRKSVGPLLVLLVVAPEEMFLLLDAFGFAGFLYAFAEVVEEIVGEHELIDLLFGFTRVVLVVDTVELEALRLVH
jgi:hypothetical protein